MVELARANHIPVILASIPPAVDFPWTCGRNPAPTISELNARLRADAISHAIIYAGFWRALASSNGGTKTRYTQDCVHPNDRGCAAMQLNAGAAIARAMRPR